MELALFVYFANIVCGIDTIFTSVTVACVIAAVVMWFWSIIKSPAEWDPETIGVLHARLNDDEVAAARKRGLVAVNGFRKKIVWPISMAIVFGLLAALTPDNEKAVYVIGGAWAAQTIGQQVINSETADLTVKVINAKLNRYLDEVTAQPTATEKKQ